nr:reverse transcriptase domain-containing protein [Tanacetum cinerariifolium]GFB21422.1 reverse transcriptase domain-containing protein [Tanacetum cinerariifolium]GFB22192.1 reverse transcriptase domain-containing protein [Tanacetum cinerariifolium]
IVTQVTNNVNNANVNDGNSGNGRNNGCYYKEFLACNPRDYDGKGGAIALTRWIKKMEPMIENSGCVENQKIDFKVLLVEEFCPSNEMGKLEREFWNHTMVGANQAGYTDRFHELAKLVPHLVTPESKRIGSAILKAGILTDEAVHCGTLIKSSEKRKEVGETSKQRGSWKDKKEAKVGKGFVAIAPPKNVNMGAYPKCTKCFTYHSESEPCRALSVNAIDALQDPNVVTGTFSLNDHFATVLYDFGADLSFISTKFAPLLNVKPSIVSLGYVIEVANGKKEVDRIIRDCKL